MTAMAARSNPSGLTLALVMVRSATGPIAAYADATKRRVMWVSRDWNLAMVLEEVCSGTQEGLELSEEGCGLACFIPSSWRAARCKSLSSVIAVGAP